MSTWGLSVKVSEEGPYVKVVKDGVNLSHVITESGQRNKATFELTVEEARDMAAQLTSVADHAERIEQPED